MFITERSFLLQIEADSPTYVPACERAYSSSGLGKPLFYRTIPVYILYVTSRNLHFGLMCTFICILEKFKVFARAKLINTFQCANGEKLPATLSSYIIVYDADWKLK